MNSTATIRMRDDEKKALTEFAEFLGMSFSDWARQTLCNSYEDYMDTRIAIEALEEYDSDPVSYSPDEVDQMLDSHDGNLEP